VLGLHDIDTDVPAGIRTSPEYPPDCEDYDELERVTEEWISTYRSRRFETAKERGTNWGIRDSVDRLAKTDREEYLDRPDVSEEKKLRLVSELNEIRILELASGYGEFAIHRDLRFLMYASTAERTHSPSTLRLRLRLLRPDATAVTATPASATHAAP